MPVKFQVKYSGGNVQEAKIPSAQLVALINSIDKVTKRVAQLRHVSETSFEYDVMIQRGSVEVGVIPPSNPRSEMVFRTALGLYTRILHEEIEEEYAKDQDIRAGIGAWLKVSGGYAEQVVIAENGNQLGETIHLTPSTYEELVPSTERPYPIEHFIARLCKVNYVRLTIGVRAEPTGYFTLNFQYAYKDTIRSLGDQYAYMKISNTDRSGYPLLIEAKSVWSDVEKSPVLQQQVDHSFSMIDSVAQLRRGWADHQAVPITSECIDSAKAFIRLVANMITHLHLPEKMPTIVPLTNGGIQFDWESQTRFLEVVFEPNSIFTILSGQPRGVMQEKVVETSKDTLNSVYQQLRSYEEHA